MVLILGPGRSSAEMKALQEALQTLCRVVCTFRVDDFFFEVRELKSLIPTTTHVVIVLDRGDHERISSILHDVDIRGKNTKIALVCMHDTEALYRFRHRILDGSIALIVVRSRADYARAQSEWKDAKARMYLADQRDLGKFATHVAHVLINEREPAPFVL